MDPHVPKLSVASVAKTCVAGGGLGCGIGCGLIAARTLSRLGKRTRSRAPDHGDSRKRTRNNHHALNVIKSCTLAGSGAAVTHRFVRNILSRVSRLRKITSPTAMATAALWMAFIPGGVIRESACLIFLSESLLAIGKMLLASHWLPQSDHYPVIIFTLSCYEIMKAWFYHPNTLPKEYVAWITSMSKTDQRLLRALRLMREEKAKIGEPFEGDFLQSYCQDNGQAREYGDPERGKMPCDRGFHYPLSCYGNASLRFRRAAQLTIPLYLFVHTLPRILFLRKTLRDPVKALKSILTSTTRSSLFLTTFITSIWMSVCAVRHIRTWYLKFNPSTDPAELDKYFDPRETWGPLLGCFVCGLCILFETQPRRYPLALYVLPRALASVYHRSGAPSHPNGDVLVLAASLSFLSYCAENRPKVANSWLTRVAKMTASATTL
eukprot:m.45226 g.45226  ORF g.45226 m.45226 type:complete len:436 (-) comp10217_c0_seq2:122-1429(-)